MLSLIADLRAYLQQYVAIEDEAVYTALACWILGTHMFQAFDVFPYLCITAPVKRCGKTTLSELVSFTANKGKSITGATDAAIFRLIANDAPTLIIDEAESLKSEGASTMRALMNVGFRRGQTIPRAARGTESGVIEAPTYCPKAFVLIGDVNDTLRDRSIIVRMTRGTPTVEYRYEEAEAQGAQLRARIAAYVLEASVDVKALYDTRAVANPIRAAVSTRDRDLWLPILAIAAHADRDQLDTLYRCAVDMATVKQTTEAKTVVEYRRDGAEEKARDDEYAMRALQDIAALECWQQGARGERYAFTADVMRDLLAMPFGPWRAFEGKGLNDHRLAHMLKRFCRPSLARVGKRTGRAYRWRDVEKALASFGQ